MKQFTLFYRKRKPLVFIAYKQLYFHYKIDQSTSEPSAFKSDQGHMKNTEEEFITLPIKIGVTVGIFLLNTGVVFKAIELCQESLILLHNGDLSADSPVAKSFEERIFTSVIRVCNSPGFSRYLREFSYHHPEEGKELYKVAIKVMKMTGSSQGEAEYCRGLGVLLCFLGEYNKGKEYLKMALAISIKFGDKSSIAANYIDQGAVLISLGKYDTTRECLEKALAIQIEIGDRHGEAQEYLERALAIDIEIGDRNGEATTYGKLGTVFISLGKYDKAQEYLERALAIQIEVGDRNKEANTYGDLGTVFECLGKYGRARQYLEKGLAIKIEIGDRDGEAVMYRILGTLFKSLSKYEKAREYLEKALAIKIEIGHRDGEAACYANLGKIGDRFGEATTYGNLGTLFLSLGKYVGARQYLEKALTIITDIGDKNGEATSYVNLGIVFQSLGNYDEAREYLEKALRIFRRIGERKGEADTFGRLASLFLSLGKYSKADDFLERAIAIWREIGDREGQAEHFVNFGAICHKRGEYDDALEYQKKALEIHMEIGTKEGVVISYRDIGLCFQSLGKYDMAEEYLKKALLLSKDIGQSFLEFQCLRALTVLKVSQDDLNEASSFIFQTIKMFDTLRGFLKDNDQFKTSLLEEHGAFPYKLLSSLLSSTAKPHVALYAEELRRARGLADLMAARYSVVKQVSGDPKSWYGIQNIVAKETDCACLYISVGEKHMRYWILKATGAIIFSDEEVSLDRNVVTGLVPDLDEFFTKSFRGLGILPEQNCIKKNLHLCHKMIIAPVAALLNEPEIIIIPDSCMYQVPFSALTDDGGNFVSDTFRLRIVPSLTTLKHIQDSPPYYHSQTGALIVGDPQVGEVIYKGRRMTITRLPCARKEAEMIGRLLGVTPLIGDRATKQAVLQAIHSVSLIHLAAHGSAERGEIALSPECPAGYVPREEAYLLTMEDISRIKLRAKLVVLSCCHSACGQIKAEGVIGIARAFLGSGARSVLAARWLLYDTATEKFMTCFYEHLFRGESASESLHEARKWMRNNDFVKASEWASFMLIGDNVTFDFANWPVSTTTK
nr:tetratricopeptide repeat protein 28-like [Pocillopora verrucosa]